MQAGQNKYLFEVSWEGCNKVGGIYTVITSKASQASIAYGENYYLLGPDLKNNLEFEETEEDCWTRMREGTAIRDIPCRFGRWRIPGNPKVILVGFGKKYDKEQLLFRLWERYGVDSIAGGWDYVEPVMFSYACGEVIETIYNLYAKPKGEKAVAHFHEWMCGAGLLAIKQMAPEVGTVFTTHATILGRTLASSGMDIYTNMEKISPLREANAHNITAKYSMEASVAREADCFTTVSNITAQEAKNFLAREPNVITPNGLDMERIPNLVEDRAPALKARARLLEAAGHFLKKDFPGDTKIMAISGRYEFHNKGIDLFLSALSRLEKSLKDQETALAYLFVLGGHKDLIPSLQCGQPSLYCNYTRSEAGAPPPIAPHRLDFEASDPILQTCSRLGLKNGQQNKVFVIFIPTYLNGHDGLINMTYYEALSGCDLGVFPSYYEPWGYTPLESAAYAVPTITTDQAGFGIWAEQKVGDSGGVILLRREGQDYGAIEDKLYNLLNNFLSWTEGERLERRKLARQAAAQATWSDFFSTYRQAYDMAVAVAAARYVKLMARAEREEKVRVFAGTVSTQPHFRTFVAVANLPANISRLRELAYNLWLAWNPRALNLFATLDPKLWEETGKNPIRILESTSPKRLLEASENSSYLALYNQVTTHFDQYMDEIRDEACRLSPLEIKCSAPVAYFSTEYGLHETLPIYSGGLGTLSGDHLKTASDLNIPLVGVGLLYKNGFFRQVIDSNGVQLAEYPENDFSTMAVQLVQDDRGNAAQISLELPGRILFANIWEIKVGRTSLYLLNTDVPANTPQDRRITDRLYSGDQRTRIEQEILLGMGGVRLLKKLGIKPSVYHINEGHSAFLILERIAILMSEEGLSFEEAGEVVRGSTIFTTHTPVEAGNERFPRELMEYYFASFVKKCGLAWSQLWDLGCKESGEDKAFFLTIMALKMSFMTNAVSRLHGRISRHMWRDVWKGFHDSDVPIGHITNGVHMKPYIAPRLRGMLGVDLGPDWG
ncbi:MAG: alpha-glucan family phosphorylase, partial [Syntrophales bacterium LBB04]|nr:alpha-glucan family phosphorylase [Syntrophales bacterium LBB04]